MYPISSVVSRSPANPTARLVRRRALYTTSDDCSQVAAVTHVPRFPGAAMATDVPGLRLSSAAIAPRPEATSWFAQEEIFVEHDGVPGADRP